METKKSYINRIVDINSCNVIMLERKDDGIRINNNNLTADPSILHFLLQTV
jgi:hypothetical protein